MENNRDLRDVHLKALAYFEAVARLGTVTKAAQELSVSASAVSQQIRILEEQFGVKLFRREKQRLILSLEGDILFQASTDAFRGLRNARDAIAHQKSALGISVRTSPSIGVRWLAPRIAGFSRLNTNYKIRVDATPEFSAFQTEAFDCDLRYGLGQWSGLTVECLMHDFLLPVSSPEYRDRFARDVPPEEALAQVNLIDSVKALYRWNFWLNANRFDVPDLAFEFRFDRSSMSIEMAKQGGGVALESAILCEKELKRGELVPFLPDAMALEFPAYWFVCPSRHLNRRIVSRFRDWIASMAKDQEEDSRATLAGHNCRIIPIAADGLAGTDQ
ncbi:LysR substrate-binding domain-containing protein [Thalassovita sp.]|uniref:LysR substrate-binding domain-containing protein n=1 Tax=Thalassovita sp. TaxID=1979401 RepID=UPI0029DE6506|nr:LysR substrate-binding domain-containing protein [Thalassovita sp.]